VPRAGLRCDHFGEIDLHDQRVSAVVPKLRSPNWSRNVTIVAGELCSITMLFRARRVEVREILSGLGSLSSDRPESGSD
jgi:hypothetical protein